MKLYPLKFRPILKERIWGGTGLKDLLGKPVHDGRIGESWELSGVPGDVSVIANGTLAGTSINELLRERAGDVLGESVVRRFGREFPVLIKFIDANQDLSIQVHPDDVLARKRHDSRGKTEMWYIMDAAKDASLVVGFDKEVSREEFNAHLEAHTLTQILNYETVREGDAFFIKAGRIHAIGAGVLLAEIQQTSDITYRVFDFNRRDENGNPRELHTDLALDAIDYRKTDDFIVDYQKHPNSENVMVRCPYFTTSYLHLKKDYAIDTKARDSFTILMCVEGTATVENEADQVSLKKGETVLVPAMTNSLKIHTGNAKLLEITI